MNVKEALFALLRSEVFDEPLENGVENCIRSVDLSALFSLAKRHDVAHLIGSALGKIDGVTATETTKKLKQEHFLAVYRYEQAQYELGEICRILEEEQVEHIPLKGAIIRRYYPEAWMRTSCDIDVFIHKNDLARAIKALEEKLGYKHTGGCPHDESLYAPSGVHVELHHDLLEEHIAGNATEYLRDVWSYTQTADAFTYKKEMADEMFYFYHIVHMAKHFKTGGCGIRAFLDTYILNHSLQSNQEKRDELLEKGGYLQFERGARELSEVWFSENEETALTKQMEGYVLHGGVYGTIDNRIAVDQAKKKSRFHYWLSRIFLPRRQLKLMYPVLEKHKYLTPVFWIVRLVQKLFGGGVKKSIREINASNSLSDTRREQTAKMLKELGLVE